jgi:hypothetical protein
MKIKAVVVLASLLLTSCESVQPWERGTLARPEMQLSSDQLSDVFYEHVYYSKEASSGGTDAAGAGCGCN